MNIVVCVKHVPDATADRQFESDNTVDRVGVDGLLSELDEYAVEQALQIKEKAGDAAMSVVPAMLAERLGLPQATYASVIETQGDQVRIKRDGDNATEVIGAT